MAIRTAPVSVGTSPTRLDTFADDSRSDYAVLVVNEGAASIRVGGSDVVMTGPTRGILVAAGTSLRVDVPAGSNLYGICASGTVDCTTMQAGVA